MCGGPTDSYVIADQAVPVPMEPVPDYSLLTAGYTVLACQMACFAAMKEVEIAVGDAGLGNDVVGVNVMGQAFNLKDGPLADTAAECGEKVRHGDGALQSGSQSEVVKRSDRDLHLAVQSTR